MLKKVLHTGLAVPDLEAAIQRFKALGFEQGTTFHKPEPSAEVAHVTNNGTTFELWQFSEPNHPQIEFIKTHLAFYSDSLEEDIDILLSEGVTLTIPITDGVKLRYAFVQDAAGTNYEIATDKT